MRLKLSVINNRIATNRSLRLAFLSTFSLDFFTSLSVAVVAVELGLRLIDGVNGASDSVNGINSCTDTFNRFVILEMTIMQQWMERMQDNKFINY